MKHPIWTLFKTYKNILIDCILISLSDDCVILSSLYSFKMSIAISNSCLVESTQLKSLYDVLQNDDRDYSNQKPWMKFLSSFFKWPLTILFSAMLTIALIRRFAVKNEPVIF